MPAHKKIRLKMKEEEEDNSGLTKIEERSSGSSMELRRVRKLTPKKRCLDDISNSEKVDPNEPSSKVTKTSSNSNKKNKSKEDDNNTMTLEQFTDIVLASEGLAVEEKAKVKKEMEEENNNSKSKTESVVANLMQNNNDLIVEVKPTKAKPVVLSPRQQPGSHIMHRHAKTLSSKGNNISLSSSVVVSVKPRIQPAKPQVLPPQNKPMNVPLMVEEWIRKMPQPEVDSKRILKRSASTEALNLSSKNVVTSKTTQIYLRPIPTPSKVRNETKLTDSKSHVTSLERRSSQYSRSPPAGHSGHSGNSSHSASPVSRSGSVEGSQLSPPRLEITKVESSGEMKKIGRAVPFESDRVHQEAIRNRALRDIQLAHTKDMHGNLPIHMSVLMRKPDLVRRYCCILQVLESKIDLFNDDKMTPLHLAVRDNSVEIVDILLSFGADPTIKDSKGNSSIHMAAISKSVEVLKLLIKNSLPKDANILNEFGMTPYHLAKLNGTGEATDILAKNVEEKMEKSVNGTKPKALMSETFPKKAPLEIPSR